MSVFINNDEINLILNYPEPSVLSVKEVLYNPEIVNILSSLDTTHANYNKIPDALYPDNIISLKQLKKHSARNLHNCNYKKTIGGKGRYYKDNTFKKGDYGHLQNCYNRVRRLIVNGKLIAIDMSNAHIEIIKNLGRILKIDEKRFEILNYYCCNRNQVLNDIMIAYDCDREIAKRYFIIILYGGSYDCWITNNNLLNKIDKKIEFMMKFELAFDVIKQELNKLIVMNGFKLIEKQINKKKDYQIEKSALAVFLQEIESKIMIVMYQYLESKGCIVRIPIHDGIWFDDCNSITNNGTSSEFLKEISDEIFNKLGLIIPLDYEDTNPNEDDLKWFENHKKFYESYCDTKDNDKIIIDSNNDDVGAGIAIINKHKDEIIRCGKIIVVKSENCWIYDIDDVNRILSNWITNANIYYYGGQDRLYNYSRAISHQNKCIQAIRNSDLIKIDNNFISNVNLKNKAYLPFKNGIWSFKEKKLYSYEELPHINFFSIIPLNLNMDINIDKFNEYLNRVIIPIFPNEIERNYFAHITSRAIAGHNEDKRWYGVSGARDCGKSVLTESMKLSFYEFFNTFNAKCLVNNKFGNPEPARALGWVANHINTRCMWSNEIDADTNTKINKKDTTNQTLNGSFIKTLASGGDEITGRRIFENEITFKPTFTMTLLFNELPSVEPANTLENYIEFCCKSKFVTKDELSDELPSLKLRDESIKNYIKDNDSIDAFTWWILNAYDDKLPIPQSIKEISDCINKDNVKLSIDDFVLKYFKTIKNRDCKLSIKQIKDILDENDYIIVSTQQINRVLQRYNIGIYDCKHTKFDDGSTTGYKYISFIKNDGLVE